MREPRSRLGGTARNAEWGGAGIETARWLQPSSEAAVCRWRPPAMRMHLALVTGVPSIRNRVGRRARSKSAFRCLNVDPKEG